MLGHPWQLPGPGASAGADRPHQTRGCRPQATGPHGSRQRGKTGGRASAPAPDGPHRAPAPRPASRPGAPRASAGPAGRGRPPRPAAAGGRPGSRGIPAARDVRCLGRPARRCGHGPRRR
ncbi:hypothetical protein EQ718_25075 (plasmid) [Paracoccus versutus]|nr:hypothetical protein EQ718_25075 [Paracoccus versutus]